MFVFDTSPLDGLALNEGLTIGNPWWDYWFPLAYWQAGGRLFTLPGPSLLHLDHPFGYGSKEWTENGNNLYSWLAEKQMLRGFELKTGSVPGKNELFDLTHHCFLQLQSSNKVDIQDEGSKLTLMMLRNAEVFRNAQIYDALRQAQAKPVRNLRRYL